MSSTADSLVVSLRSIVIEHYEKDSSPLLLSDLGDKLRRRGLWPPRQNDGKTLRQFIEDARDPDLLIVRDQGSPAYVAVTTSSAKRAVEQFIDRRSQSSATIPDLGALPRSVLLAFCVRQESGKDVFICKVPPFKYELEPPAEDKRDQFLVVEERYRRPGLKVADLANLNATDRLDLQARIAAWSRDNGVRLEDFYRLRGKKHANALERLLAAQPSGMAEKILIPADIALMLCQRD